MRFSQKWLSELVDIPQDPETLEKAFIRTGTEVEAVETTGKNFDHIVVGEIVSKEPHPDSDHMWLTQVNVGDKNTDEQGNNQPLQVVCGAQNFKEGDKIVCAMIGAKLPGDIKIKKSKLRGVVSYGMNCSAQELGIGQSSDGIMILESDARPGCPLDEYLDNADTIFDCEITPNRPDCLSYIGFAQECSAIFNSELHVELPNILREHKLKSTSSQLSVDIDKSFCQRYCARVIEDIDVCAAQLPEYMSQRLAYACLNSSDVFESIANYSMLFYGQPIFMYDADKLIDNKIVMRSAREGEEITSAQGKTYTLQEGMPLVCRKDGQAIALAGVFQTSLAVPDQNTTRLVVEAACYDAGLVSRTSRALQAMNDKTIRFERKVDAASCDEALACAVAYLERVFTTSQAFAGVLDIYPKPYKAQAIDVRPERVRQLCGADIAVDDIQNILEHLGCATVLSRDAQHMEVIAPTSRPDLIREIDFIEEILRIWGMDRVEPTLPSAKNHVGGLTRKQQTIRTIHRSLQASGLYETKTYCFSDPCDMQKILDKQDISHQQVRLLDPLVSEQSILRMSLLPGLLQSVSYNLAQSEKNIALYEIGRTIRWDEQTDSAKPQESTMVCGLLSGAWDEAQWNAPKHLFDFYDIKGVVEQLLDTLHVAKQRYIEPDYEQYSYLQPGASACVYSKKQALGWVGAIHPSVLSAFDIEQAVYAFEFDLDALLQAAGALTTITQPSLLPGIEYDVSLVIDTSVSSEMLLQRVSSAGGKFLQSVRIFDVYEDEEKLGAHKKALAVKLMYHSDDHTLTAEEVEKTHTKLLAKVTKALGAEVRG